MFFCGPRMQTLFSSQMPLTLKANGEMRKYGNWNKYHHKQSLSGWVGLSVKVTLLSQSSSEMHHEYLVCMCGYLTYKGWFLLQAICLARDINQCSQSIDARCDLWFHFFKGLFFRLKRPIICFYSSD